MFHGNTEETFVLSTFKEFVKIWGSEGRAKLNIECKDGSAWIKLTAQLAHPASHHYLPHQDQPYPSSHRQKGPARREKDRQRAAAHRARLEQLPAAARTNVPTCPPVHTAASAVASPSERPAAVSTSSPPPVASTGQTPSPTQAAPAGSTPSLPAASAVVTDSLPQGNQSGTRPSPQPAGSSPAALSGPRPSQELPPTRTLHDVQDVLCPDNQYEESHAQSKAMTLEDFKNLIAEHSMSVRNMNQL